MPRSFLFVPNSIKEVPHHDSFNWFSIFRLYSWFNKRHGRRRVDGPQIISATGNSIVRLIQLDAASFANCNRTAHLDWKSISILLLWIINWITSTAVVVKRKTRWAATVTCKLNGSRTRMELLGQFIPNFNFFGLFGKHETPTHQSNPTLNHDDGVSRKEANSLGARPKKGGGWIRKGKKKRKRGKNSNTIKLFPRCSPLAWPGIHPSIHQLQVNYPQNKLESAKLAPYLSFACWIALPKTCCSHLFAYFIYCVQKSINSRHHRPTSHSGSQSVSQPGPLASQPSFSSLFNDLIVAS